jgi:hypothetical protein
VSAAKFRVMVYGTRDGINYGPMVVLEYAGTPIGWTVKDGNPVQVGSITIEPVGVSPPGTQGTFTSVCAAPAMGGSPTCELELGHWGFHAHTEEDESGKEHTYRWGSKEERPTSDIEGRFDRALKVLQYVADVYNSPLVKEAIKELTAEPFEFWRGTRTSKVPV